MHTMASDPFLLERFVQAQAHSYAAALSELKAGRKQSHWIWYVLPQRKGLGHSEMSQRYGISGLAEAKAYLAHPVLGGRLVECVEAILQHRGQSAQAILGVVDAQKFHSCLTLFALVSPHPSCVDEALQQFFGGERDAGTLDQMKV